MLTSVKDRIVKRVDSLTKEGRVYIFLTSAGGYFCSLIFILFIISLSYANSLAYLCSFLFFSVVFVSCHVTNYNLYGLEIKRIEQEDYYFENEPICLKCRVENSGDKPRYDIEASLLKGSSSFLLEVSPGKSGEITIEVPSKKIGVHQFKKVELRTSFPFGIFRSWKPVRLEGEILVLPRPLSFPMPNEVSFLNSEGEYRTKLQREEFLEHSRYENSNANRLDWKLFAKREELYVKDFDSAKANLYEFSLDKTPGKTLKEKQGHLVYWLLNAEKEGARYSLTVGSKRCLASSGKGHLLACFRILVEGRSG